MALKKIRLGDLIEPFKEKCGIFNLTPYEVSGVNKDKEFFEPSNQVGTDTSNYQNVPPKYFACNLMHVGRDCVLPIAYNHTNATKHVSPAYTIFKLKNNDVILDYYFMILVKSNEKDRFFWFNTDSSIRDGMSFDDFCSIEIELPDLQTQEKFVNVYLSMLENQKMYEKGLDDLKLTCYAIMEKLKKTMALEEIGKYLELKKDRNPNNKIKEVYGVSNKLQFVTPSSTVDKTKLFSYKIVNYGDIAYVPTTHMKIWAVAISNDEKQFVVSPIYEVFRVKEKSKLYPEFLFLWLCRRETIRYAFYNSWGSARENFAYDDMCQVKIPIPDIKIQKAIADIFNVYNLRKEINEKLKEQIKKICPILIRGSLEEGK